MQRYDPIQRFQMGGHAYGEMKECDDGDYVKFEDAEAARCRPLLNTLLISENSWKPISDECKDGRIVWLRDKEGYVDLATWSRGEWTTDCGAVADPTQYADVTITDKADKDGHCGRCGRVRGGP